MSWGRTSSSKSMINVALIEEYRSSILGTRYRDRLVVRTLRCGRSNPGSNPGHGNVLSEYIVTDGAGYPPMRWLQETSLYLNTTVNEVLHSCSSTVRDDLTDKCFMAHMVTNKVDFDLWIYSVRKIDKVLFHVLLTSMTEDLVILVPRFPINTFQLFTMPFLWPVWVTLLLLLGSLEVIKFLFPVRFKNDPVLLIVCGYERYNLHKASILEKSVLISFVFLMFLMTRAYETKILSFMVSKPATQEIRSFQDMAQSGVKLKYNPKVNPFVFEERALRDLLVESNDTLPNLDLIHAYIAERSISELKLIPMYYDPVNKMYRYSVMEQSFGMFPVVYKFSARSPLKAVFGFTLTTFIEKRAPPSLKKTPKKKKKRISGLARRHSTIGKVSKQEPVQTPMPLHRKEKIKWEINFQLLFPVSTTSSPPYPLPKRGSFQFFRGVLFPLEQAEAMHQLIAAKDAKHIFVKMKLR
ncbi:conserved hypothetical protein [Culex quinquefasciatus]|uniref:Uncharacterized protein n=1 Tax=Culex quinquefasciatus TaxID=7176 RepID=B0W254_CULQU|nr:conserved hypothetical protein [Culex quinquefasciatus]|eukprot:XP_001842817.1 conserved hypothetical protein [Culex quinquefasciatus]